MSDKIELEIVTPKGRALTASVDEVTAPSVNGEFGVLPGHLPVVAALRTGLVTYRQGSESKKVAVAQGFAEAGQNKLLILAEDFAAIDHLGASRCAEFVTGRRDEQIQAEAFGYVQELLGRARR